MRRVPIEQRGKQYGLALHALTCGTCKPKATRVLETTNHIERWELVAQIELHERRLAGRELHA